MTILGVVLLLSGLNTPGSSSNPTLAATVTVVGGAECAGSHFQRNRKVLKSINKYG
jgi:hypothetical protein